MTDHLSIKKRRSKVSPHFSIHSTVCFIGLCSYNYREEKRYRWAWSNWVWWAKDRRFYDRLFLGKFQHEEGHILRNWWRFLMTFLACTRQSWKTSQRDPPSGHPVGPFRSQSGPISQETNRRILFQKWVGVVGKVIPRFSYWTSVRKWAGGREKNFPL